GDAFGDGPVQRLAGDLHQLLGGRRDLADRDGAGRITAPAVLEGPEIYGQYVTRLEHHVLARDAVDDHLVDRRAQDGRVAVVAEEGRFALELLQPLVGDLVELPGRHPRLRRGFQRVQDVGDDP